MRASFEAGFAPLGSASAKALCLLGLCGGAELGLAAAASLLNQSVGQTEEVLERLVDLNLVQSPQHGRYLLNGLVREFASEKARSGLTDDQHQAVATLWRLPHARTA